MLYGWYKILDKRMPGTSIATSIKKSVIDVVGCGIPYYSAFYCGKQDDMNIIIGTLQLNNNTTL